jgi:N6-adenosine-specific RNA methylase IME4
LGEYAENAFRKSFTPSEMAAVADAIEPLERAKAKERQGGRTDKHPGKFPASSMGNALDKVGKVVGRDRKTLQKARAVCDAAKADPEKFGKLQADMDRTGRVDGVYKRLCVLQQADRIRAESPPMPHRGPYRVIVADPPWPYEKRTGDPSHRVAAPYPKMSIQEIRALDVASIAHRDCVLWLWTTNAHLLSADALLVLKAWGFTSKTMLTWGKARIGTGDWLRGQTEHCILAVRGNPIVTLTNQTTLMSAALRGHSQKPREFYDLVETLCPAPRYASLFSGGYQYNDRWDCDQPSYAEAAE